MDFYSFVAGPLLWIAFLTFIIGTLIRVALLIAESRQKDKIVFQHLRWKWVFATFGRWILPANPTVAKNPIYFPLVYIFHICLLAVPIWYSGHIVLWEESRLGWSWTPMPEGLADWMTLVFLAIAIFLLLRRIFSSDIRTISTFADYFVLIVTALPFATGYFLTHGTLDGIGFLGNNMTVIHMLAGEAMLILIPFTKLSHFVLFFFSRGATAVEFGRRDYAV